MGVSEIQREGYGKGRPGEYDHQLIEKDFAGVGGGVGGDLQMWLRRRGGYSPQKFENYWFKEALKSA